jgi:hypothetical protein
MNPKKQATFKSAQANGKRRHDQVMRWASRAAILTLSFACAAAHAGGGGGGLDGITSSVQMVANVIAACGALIATIGVGLCGYKVTMEGATFRDVSNKLLGCGIIGGASAIAAAFGA